MSEEREDFENNQDKNPGEINNRERKMSHKGVGMR